METLLSIESNTHTEIINQVLDIKEPSLSRVLKQKTKTNIRFRVIRVHLCFLYLIIAGERFIRNK